MNIDVNKIDLTDFNVRECYFAGDECVWVYPKLEGTSWKADNLHLRSSIWRKSDGELVSAGYKKFFNWAEKPDIYPGPTTIHNRMRFVEKVDGSCVIVSKYKGELIVRTRRSPVEMLPNGAEIELIKKKYPKAFNNALLNTEGFSLLFEWVTPSNLIVLRYPESDLRLTNIVTHEDYSYWTQDGLDNVAKEIGVPRPKYFKFGSLEEMFENVTKIKGEEGVCVYYGGDDHSQHIRKVKSEWYNIIHAFRGEMSFKNIVDLYLESGMPNYNEFSNIILEQFDYEGLQIALPLVSTICDGKRESDKIVQGMKDFIAKQCDNLPNRKEKAEKIISAYGKTSRADIAFTLLDKHSPSTQQWKKLLFQTMLAK